MATKRLINTPDDVAVVLAFLDEHRIPASWSGLCVWIECEADEQLTGILNRLGFEYSKKREAWYLRGADGIPAPKSINETLRHERSAA